VCFFLQLIELCTTSCCLPVVHGLMCRPSGSCVQETRVFVGVFGALEMVLRVRYAGCLPSSASMLLHKQGLVRGCSTGSLLVC